MAETQRHFFPETYRSIVESAPDAMVVVDSDGRVVLVNAQTEELFGYTRDELLEETIERLIPLRFRERHVDHRTEYENDRRVRPMGAGLQLLGLRKNGVEFPVEISLSPIATNGVSYTAAAIRDVTDRKRLEKELMQKNEDLVNASVAKDRFLAGMSHELRTPLNAVIGFTGTLLMKLPGPLTDEQTDQLRIVQSNARHLLSLIDDVLDLAKIESGKVELHLEPVIVQDVVDEVVESIRGSAYAKSLQLQVDVPHEAVRIVTDRRALRQIVTNLTGNAVKYTETGSIQVELLTGSSEGQTFAELRVRDTGIGIDPNDIARLFAPFERIDSATARKAGGAGLGLHLSRRFAELLGGRLECTSEPGKGSTFTLILPVQ